MPPIDTSTSSDPTNAAFVDGITCTECGDDVIVYGGPMSDRVWRLHLPTATWTEVPCFGSIPLPRYFHSACYCSGYLVVCGGELITSDTYCHAERLNYYELNLSTYEWSCIDCFGDVPANRSHHTMTCIKNTELLLFGGKPISPGVSSVAIANRVMTNKEFIEHRQAGFYDVFVLHAISRTWTKVEMYDPLSPVVWGHTAALYQNSHLLFFGGCDVSHTEWRPSSGTGAAFAVTEDVPTASLSNTVHILALQTFQWQQCEASTTDQAPVARALHVAHCSCDEMMVFGGFTVNRFGAVMGACDCWLWSVKKGTWRRVDFCLPQWSSKKLLAAVYGTQWIVMPAIDTVFFMEMSRVHIGWQRASCTVQKLLAAPSQRGIMAVRAGMPTRGDSVTPAHLSVPSPAKVSADPYESPFDYRAPNGAVDDTLVRGTPDVVQQLRWEIQELREQLSFVQTHHATTHEVGFVTNADHSHRELGVTGKRLQRWADALSPTAGGNNVLVMQTKGVASSSNLNEKNIAGVSNGSMALVPGSTSSAAASPTLVPQPHANDEPRLGDHGQLLLLHRTDSSMPHFIDSDVLDAATQRKLEAFRRLQAKSQAQRMEDALRRSGSADRDPPHSDASEENDDMQQVAELGLQVHRARISNTESRRQLLFRERKRRIQGLQDRLRTLEADAAQHQHLRSGLHSGNSPDAKTVDIVAKQAENIRRMLEEGTAPLDLFDSTRRSSLASSLRVLAPNTNEETLRSSSFGSLSTTDDVVSSPDGTAGRGDSIPNVVVDDSAIVGSHVTPATTEEVQQKHTHGVQDTKLLGTESSADFSSLSRKTSTLSEGGHQTRRTPESSHVVRLPSNASSVGGASRKNLTNTQSPEAEPAPRIEPVFRGFQRQRAKTSAPSSAPSEVRKEGVTENPSATTPNAASTPTSGRVLRIPGSATAASSEPAPSKVAAEDQTKSAAGESTRLTAPPQSNIQGQWDVLQAALMASAAPRRAFKAAEI